MLYLVSLLIYVSFKRLNFIYFAYLRGRCSRSERGYISRPLPDDLVIPANFEVGQEFYLCFFDQLLLMFFKFLLVFSR
jgi:hypothetical protein